jgi:uridine kinase
MGRAAKLALCLPAFAAAAAMNMLQKSREPFFIGVAGGTASGKTSVVERVVSALRHDSVVSITLDCFYRDLSDAERERANANDFDFDHPNAFDFDHLLEVVDELKRGGDGPVAIPTYDFVTHSRLSAAHDTHISCPQIVIVEGILALYDERLRDRFDMKIFVDADPDVRLARRIKRDIAQRGRDLDGVLQQYEQFVKPSFETFIGPSKRHADIVVPRGAENLVAIDLIAQHINQLLIEREAVEALDWDERLKLEEPSTVA